jgi:predicted transcriptional regulator
LQPWGRAIEWNPWEEFTQIDWFKEPTASKRATLSRSLQNLEDRGLIGRQTGKGTKKRVSQKHTTYVSLTELGYLTAKLTFLPESLNLQESATKHRCPSSQEAAEMLN